MKQLTFEDKTMKKYVQFVCDMIPEEFGASLYRTMSTLPGTTYKFPYKNIGIPVKVISTEILTRSAIFDVEALGHRKQVHVFMSRVKGPEVLLSDVQSKMDDAVNDIVKENGLDVEKLRESHDDMLKFFKSRTSA